MSRREADVLGHELGHAYSFMQMWDAPPMTKWLPVARTLIEVRSTFAQVLVSNLGSSGRLSLRSDGASWLTPAPACGVPDVYTVADLLAAALYAHWQREGQYFAAQYKAVMRDTALLSVEGWAEKHLGADLS